MIGRFGRPASVCAALLGVLLVTAAAPPAQAHTSSCNTGTVTEQILLPSTDPDRGSVTEYVQLFALHGTPLESNTAVNGAVNGKDAYIHDLGCHSSGNSLDLVGDQDHEPYKLQVRHYSHLGFERGETDCQKSFSGETIPDGTQYVAVVACEGAPRVVDPPNGIPYTVEVTLTTS